MKLNRNYVTPFISLVFLIVGLSGLFMFFHLFDGYTEVVHEYLGVFFVLCAVFHIILNWKALRIHFKRGVLMPALFAVLTVSSLFIIGESIYPPLDTVIIKKIVKAPIEDALKALDIHQDRAAENLRTKGIMMEGAKTIEDLWLNTNADPEEVIDLLFE